MLDLLGYGTAKRNGRWRIVDRTGVVVPGVMTFTSDALAQKRADAMNRKVYEARVS